MLDIFTDGSTTDNCRLSKKSRGGVGVFFKKKDKRNIAEPFFIYPITNQRCEFYAVIRAIQIIASEKIKGKIKIRIITDAKYVIDTMTNWVHKWKVRGWKKSNGDEPINMDLIYWLDALTTFHQDKITVTYEHVLAHKNEPKKSTREHYKWLGNAMADRLAAKGRTLGCAKVN